MTPLEVVGTVVGTLVGLTALTGGLLHVVALPYLREHLIEPLLERLDAMHARDGDLETANRIAALMFEGHMTHSESDRGHLWAAIGDLRKDRHRHD